MTDIFRNRNPIARISMMTLLLVVMFLVETSRKDLFAQPLVPGPGEFTLAQCLDMAKAQSPVLASRRHQLEAARARAWSGVAGLLPSVSGSGSVTRSSGTVGGGSSLFGNPSATSLNTNYSLGLSGQVPLFDLNAWATVGSRQASLVQAQALTDQEERDLTYNVSLAYLTLQLRQENLSVADTAVSIARIHLEQAQSRFQIGLAPQLEVFQAKSALASAQADEIDAQNAVALAWQDLGRSLGREVQGTGRVTPFQSLAPVPAPPESVSMETIHRLPEWQAAKAQEDQSISARTAAWARIVPSLDATGRLGYSGSEFPLGHSWSAGLSLSWNLFDSWSSQSGIRAAGEDLESRRQDNQDLYLSLRQSLENSRLTLLSAGRKLDASQDAVTFSREAYRLAEGRYQNGAGSAIEQEDARLNFIKARYSQTSSTFDYLKAKATWERYTLPLPSER